MEHCKTENTPKTHWTVCRDGKCGIELLTVDLGGTGAALPIFSYKEEAEMFLWLQGIDFAWKARRTPSGELISLLCGPCSRVERVLLDPLPYRYAALSFTLVGVDRERFMRIILDGRTVEDLPVAQRMSLPRAS